MSWVLINTSENYGTYWILRGAGKSTRTSTRLKGSVKMESLIH